MMAYPARPYPKKPRKSTNPAVIAHDAQRCQICGGCNVWFGFGPPLSDTTLYACREHHVALGEQLAAPAPAQRPAPPPKAAPTPPTPTTGDQLGLF